MNTTVCSASFRHVANYTKPGTTLIETALTGEFLYLQRGYKRTWWNFSHGFEGLMIDDGSDEISCLVGNFFLSFFLLFTRILGRFFLWWWHKSPHRYILPEFCLVTVYLCAKFVVIFSSRSHSLALKSSWKSHRMTPFFVQKEVLGEKIEWNLVMFSFK